MRTFETVRLDDIVERSDASNDALSASYAASMRAGDKFPPVNLSRNQHGVLAVCDGRHRIAAMRLLGLTSCAAVIDSNRD